MNTREEGWKDLKIAVISKREAGEPTTPDNWKKQRLPGGNDRAGLCDDRHRQRSFARRGGRGCVSLGVTCLANVHALADGAGWIWKAVQRLPDRLCADAGLLSRLPTPATSCAERIFGEETAETTAAYRHARGLLLRQGWQGVCQWVGELLAVADEAERERRRTATDRLIGYFAKHTQPTELR